MVEYLVTYGHAGYLGRFRADGDYARDERVVVRTERGIEVGTVLGLVSHATSSLAVAGDVLRLATNEDLLTESHLHDRLTTILADAHSLTESDSLPLLFLDGEIMLDGREAILHAVHWAECDATPLFEELSRRHGLTVKLADLTTTPKKSGCSVCGAEKSGCDSCGTGGGCSSGSCSRGSIKNADDMTAYFAGLRKQMEAAGDRVSLH